jgi:hypothetical protein
VGVRVEWAKIMDTGLVFRASQREVDIDEERSGAYLVGQGRLTAAEQRLLRRDGTDTAMSLSYNIPVAEGQVLRLEVGFLSADRDGDAMSRETYRAQLAWAVKGDPISWTFTGEVGSSEYDKANPIYREAQDSAYYALGAAGFYQLPWQGWSEMLSVRYANEDSDVDFHDQQLSSVMLGAQYFFGGR